MSNIDILEKFIEEYRVAEEVLDGEVIDAIETLISENKELKEENFNLKQKQIIDKCSIPRQDNFYDYYNFIPKSKVEEKIEEINKEMLNEENSLELFNRKRYCREVLQSLLEKE